MLEAWEFYYLGLSMEYFKHDINASYDDKICDLLASGGYELFGYYWRFIEHLYSIGGRVDKSKIKGVAWSLHMDVEKLLSVIYDYDLFCEDENTIFSKRVVNEIEEFDAVGRRMAEIGRMGGQARAKRALEKNEADAKRMLNHTLTESQAYAQQKKRKENKIKENKIDKRESNTASPSPAPETDPLLKGFYKNVRLSDNEVASLRERFPTDWEKRIDRLSKYMADSGKTYASHYDTIIRWAEQDKPKQETQYGSFDTDEFFEAALKNTLKLAEEIKK